MQASQTGGHTENALAPPPSAAEDTRGGKRSVEIHKDQAVFLTSCWEAGSKAVTSGLYLNLRITL